MAWNTTQAAWEGPVKMDRIDTHGPLPGGRHRRHRAVAGRITGPATRSTPASLASVVRGFGTAEYLLFGSDDPAEVTAPAAAICCSPSPTAPPTGPPLPPLAWADGWKGGPPYADTLAGRADDAMEANAALAELIRGSTPSSPR